MLMKRMNRQIILEWANQCSTLLAPECGPRAGRRRIGAEQATEFVCTDERRFVGEQNSAALLKSSVGHTFPSCLGQFRTYALH